MWWPPNDGEVFFVEAPFLDPEFSSCIAASGSEFGGYRPSQLKFLVPFVVPLWVQKLGLKLQEKGREVLIIEADSVHRAQS